MKKDNFFKKFLAVSLVAVTSFSINQTFAKTNQSIENCSCYSSPHLKNKKQSINGPCWAFANIATLETFLNKKGILKNSLSEKHLLSYVNQSSNNNGLHISIYNGGCNSFASGYFSAGIGPVFENECIYNTNNTTFNSNLAAIKPKYWVKGIKTLNNDINSIKKAIAEYGAATIIYPINSSLFHAVSATGWDDNNRKWIVKDSSKSSNNYTYLPYSTNIIECSCITDAEAFPSNLKIYKHDDFVVTGTCYSKSTLTVANVFDFDGNETLDSITMFSNSDNAKVNIYLVPVLSDGSPSTFKAFWTNLYSGVVPHKGYFTFSLNNKINLGKNKYAIIVQLEKNGGSDIPNVGYQASYENLTLPPYQSGKSFILCGSKFLDPKNILKLDNFSGFSIKAVTRKK